MLRVSSTLRICHEFNIVVSQISLRENRLRKIVKGRPGVDDSGIVKNSFVYLCIIFQGLTTLETDLLNANIQFQNCQPLCNILTSIHKEIEILFLL